MAQDDMHVVMYKILSYLYDCMKRGAAPNISAIKHDSDLLDIPHEYWVCVMSEMVDKGLIKGVGVMGLGGNKNVAIDVCMYAPQVTFDGVEFLKENSMMRKAYNFLKDAKTLMPFMS